jgi:hypothetical protein
MHLPCRLAAAMIVTAHLPGYSHAQDIPRFLDFPAEATPLQEAPQVQISTPDAWAFRARLREAAKQPPNFAGHYVLAQWGCGTTCVTGAAVDLLTGKVTFLPFSICCWGAVDSGFRPIEIRSNSRLAVFSGLRNEAGEMGSHFYSFDGVRFNHLLTLETPDDFGASARRTPPRREQPSRANPGHRRPPSPRQD